MPFQTIFQNAFIGGQLSPRLWARVDLERFLQGAALLENFLIMPHGGIVRRSGTIFIIPVKDESKLTLLKRFELGNELRYILEWGESYLRFHFNRGTVVDGRGFVNGTFDSGIEGWTDTSSGTGQIKHDAVNQKMQLEAGGSGNEARAEQSLKAVSTQQYTVTVDVFVGAITYKVGTSSGADDLGTGTLAAAADQTFNFTSATSQEVFFTFENANNDTREIDNVRLSMPIYEIDTPYLESDLPALSFARTVDALYIFHPDWAPRKLSRPNTNEWYLDVLDFQDGPYLDLNPKNLPTTTLTPSAATGSVTITASSTDGINDGEGFLATDNGRLLRLDNGGGSVAWGWGVITGITSPTICTVAVREDFAGVAATNKWRLGAWSNTTGWPAVGTFWQQRLEAGNTALEKDRVWLSELGIDRIEQFAPSEKDGQVNDSNAITVQIADENNEVVWLAGGEDLAVGTVRGERTIWSGTRGGQVKPTLIDAPRRTSRGSAPLIEPLIVDNQLLHVQTARRKLREFRYNFSIDGYVSKDITVVAEDITFGDILELAYQQEPNSVVWNLKGDGKLAAITYDWEQQIEAWHQHAIAGELNGGDAQVESIATVLGMDGEEDELWMVVARTIDGQTRRYIEVMDKTFDAKRVQQKDAVFMDSAIIYEGAPTNLVAGADHLEGLTVQILADGSRRPDVVVTGGQIQIEGAAASKIIAGLGYASTLQMLPVEGGAVDEGSVVRLRAVAELHIQFFETLGARYSDDGVTWYEIPFRSVTDAMDTPPPIQDRVDEVTYPGEFTRQAQPWVQQINPFPMTIKAIAYGIDVGGG